MAKDPFFLDVQKFADGFIKGAEAAVRVTALRTFAAIIKRTPVDEGRARANWFATGKMPSVRKTDDQDTSKDGKDTANKAKDITLLLKDWSEFNLTNNLPYIRPLEFGLYPKPPKNGTRINESGTRQNPIKPIYEIRSVLGFSSQAVGGMVRISILKSNMILEEEFKKRAPK
jgi:hypothetical protein